MDKFKRFLKGKLHQLKLWLRDFVQRFIELWILDIIMLLILIIILNINESDRSNYIAEFFGIAFTVYLLDFLYLQQEKSKDFNRKTRFVLLVHEFHTYIDGNLKMFFNLDNTSNLSDFKDTKLSNIIWDKNFWSAEIKINDKISLKRETFLKTLLLSINKKATNLEITHQDLLLESNLVVHLDMFQDLYNWMNLDFITSYSDLKSNEFHTMLITLIEMSERYGLYMKEFLKKS